MNKVKQSSVAQGKQGARRPRWTKAEKKAWRKAHPRPAGKNQAKKGEVNLLGQTSRQQRGDPRQGKKGITLTRNDLVTTAQTTIPITVKSQQASMWAFAMGYVAKAMEKGFATSATNQWDPYFAFVYLTNLLSQYQSNSVPPALELPYVLHCFGRAMVTKEVGFANGRVTYTMAPVLGGNPPLQIPIGYSTYGYTYNLLWVPDAPTFTGMFPNMTSSGIPAYTDAQGATAFAEMNTYLTREGQADDYRKVSSNIKTPWDKDVSAYAVLSQQQGLGARDVGSGGFGCQAQLEVPMFRPLLTLLNPIQSDFLEAAANRYPNLTVNVAGDPCVLGGLSVCTIPLRHFGMKRALKFHPVDFNEYLETLAFWVQGLQQAAVQDPITPQQVAITTLACPLTLQEVSFLLRNTFMDIFKDTQAGVQGLYPEVPASGTDNQFVPFTASMGTCFLQSVPWELPVGFIEDIRASAFREVNRGKNDREYFIPVVGINALDVISSASFTYSSVPTGGDETINSFSIPTQANFKKKVFNEKTNSFEIIVVPETVISLVDGSAPGVAVAINDPASLTTLAQTWNVWMKDSGLMTYSETLGIASAEKGINVLFNGNMTRHWVPSSGGNGTLALRRQLSDRFVTKRSEALFTSPYANRIAVCDTAQSIPLAAPYSQIQKVWILPSIQSEISISAPPNSTANNRWQILMSEPYLMNASSGFDGISLTEMHSIFAQKMIKGRNSPPDDWDNFFVEAAKKGRGGILSSLIGGAISSFFPAAKPIVDAVEDFVPF